MLQRKKKIGIIAIAGLFFFATDCEDRDLEQKYRSRLWVWNVSESAVYFYERYEGMTPDRFNTYQNHWLDRGSWWLLNSLDSDLPISYDQLVRAYNDEKPGVELLFIYYDKDTGQRDTVIKEISNMEVEIQKAGEITKGIEWDITEYNLLFKG